MPASDHPIRRRILEAIGTERRSPIELTAATGIQLELLAYHVRTLRRRGILESAGNGRVRGAVQHFYRVSASGVDAEIAELEERLSMFREIRDTLRGASS